MTSINQRITRQSEILLQRLIFLCVLICSSQSFVAMPTKFPLRGTTTRLLSVSQSTTGIKRNDLRFRSPKLADVDPISNLLVDCFETELKWFEFPEKENRRKRYRDMLQESFVRKLENPESLNFMLVVESENDNNKLVGFVQMGMLPPPPGFQQNDDNSDQNDDAAETAEWNGVPVDLPTPPTAKNDVPYMANLCVLPDYRQTGIGKKLIEVCFKWLEKRGHGQVFIAVDSDNMVAKRFYQHNEFQWIEAKFQRDYYYRDLALNEQSRENSLSS